MPQVRRLYDAPLCTAVALHIWQQLKTALSLVKSEVGSEVNLDPGNISERLPMSITSCGPVRGEKDRARKCWTGVYPLEISYLRAMADGEDAEEVTRAFAVQIAQLFMREENWTLPTWTNLPGALFRSIHLDGIEVLLEEDLQDIPQCIGHGKIYVTAEIDSFLYTP